MTTTKHLYLLPSFSLLHKQPDPPHVARTIAETIVPNEYGTGITYTVRVNRKGTVWWIDASLNGMRMSNTLRTTSKARGESWIRMVKAGDVGIAEEGTKP